MKARDLVFFLVVSLAPVIALGQNVNDDLIAAVKKGDADAVKSLIAKGANVNTRTNYGATALHFAADRGNMEIIKILVEAGADVNARDEFYKMTPTMMAMMRQNKDVIAYLQNAASAKKDAPQAAPQPAPQPSTQPAATAPAANSQPAAVSPQPAAVSPQPAAVSPQPAAVSPQPAAVSPQPAVKTADPALNEELLGAAKRGDAAAIKSLLARGADVNAKTRYNQTPLMFAADKGHLEASKTLIDAGADLNVVDTFYKSFTALVGAAREGHAEVVKLLLDKGANDKDQALIIGAQSGRAAVVKVALALGGFKEETLNRALGFASENKEIADMLKEAGAEQKQLKPEFKVDDATLQKYAGTYRLDEASQYTFIARDGKLGGWDVRQYSFSLTAVEKNVFRFGNNDSRTITFNEKDGRVISMTA